MKDAVPANGASSYLYRATLLRLLAVWLLVLGPHALHLPWWETTVVLTVLTWRACAALRRWRMPSKWLRTALTLAAFAAIYANYGRVSGQNAGVALLVIMAALKLTEMDRRRDVMVTVFLLYFVCATHFLFSQEIWTLAYLLLAAVAITAILIEANHAGEPLPLAVTAKRGGMLVLQSLPLMLVMFVLFPRVPGPLWGLPSDAGAARSGLSDRMAPGDISSLIQSNVLAFRVRFDGAVPPQRQLYWRGPIFWDFDGREWSEGFPAVSRDDVKLELFGTPVDFEVVLEPHRALWLFALDLPDPRALPSDARMTPDGRLLAHDLVRERMLYRARSYPDYRLQTELPERLRRAALSLPLKRNPRAQALAQHWRELGLSGQQVVDAALTMFRSQPFFYTLKPPLLGDEPVDDFLFKSRRGFCEHYASSFTVLMRAAGVPARVVTGYQGGQKSALGGDYAVYQSDAHAWAEVWLQGSGWVRVDPTAAVAPNRIEQGLESALSFDEAAPFGLQRRGSDLFNGVQARWDFVNAQWNRWVLAFGPEVQRDLLQRFGLEGWRDLMLSLTLAVSLLLGVFGALALRRALPVRNEDAALIAWRKATRRLSRTGLIQKTTEGPQQFAARVVAARPDLAAAMGRLTEAYLAARYLDTKAGTSVLLAAAKAFKPSRMAGPP